VSLFGDGGDALAEWVQVGEDGAVDLERIELYRSRDGAIASVAAAGVITVVDLRDGRVMARARAGSAIEAALPLDATTTLEVSGELMLDGGFSGHYGGRTWFAWPDSEPRPDEAEIARLWAEPVAAAKVAIRRRIAVRGAERTVVVHDAESSRVEGGEVLAWPPIAGPAGVLLRHVFVVDDAKDHTVESQRPWLVRSDGTVTQLPFELGVSPLLATRDGRWLLPGADALWRDGYDEPLSLLDVTGRIEPLLVAGRPVPPSRVLEEAAPHILASLGPVDPGSDVPWEITGARWDANELLIAIGIDTDDQTRTLLLAGLPLDASAPARTLAYVEPDQGSQVAIAP
jgi:hypothetical protein